MHVLLDDFACQVAWGWPIFVRKDSAKSSSSPKLETSLLMSNVEILAGLHIKKKDSEKEDESRCVDVSDCSILQRARLVTKET